MNSFYIEADKISTIELLIHSNPHMREMYINKPEFKKLKDILNNDPDLLDLLYNIIVDYDYIYSNVRKIINISTLYYYKKELFKNSLYQLNKFYVPYYKEYFNITQSNFSKLKQDEKIFLNEYGKFKLTNLSSFYILLYRHKKDKDFYLHNINFDENNLKDEYDLFYDSYKKSDFFKNRYKKL